MKKIRLIIVISILVFLLILTVVGMKTSNDIDLSDIKPGDILIACSIRSPMPGYWDHSAIYFGNGEIIGANDEGVKIFSIETFYSRNKVVVLKVNTSDEIREKVVEFAKSKVGDPFKWIWADKQQGDSYYCSEIVWAAYYNASKGTVNLDSYDPPIPNPVFPAEIASSKYVEKISGAGTTCYYPPIIESFIFMSDNFDKIVQKIV